MREPKLNGCEPRRWTTVSNSRRVQLTRHREVEYCNRVTVSEQEGRRRSYSRGVYHPGGSAFEQAKARWAEGGAS